MDSGQKKDQPESDFKIEIEGTVAPAPKTGRAQPPPPPRSREPSTGLNPPRPFENPIYAAQTATFWERATAMTLDFLILVLVDVLLLKSEGRAAFVVIFLSYFGYFHASSLQATPGKWVLGLKVVDLEGERISFGASIGRVFTQSVFSLGWFFALFTEKKQAAHDKVAGTMVLAEKENSQIKVLLIFCLGIFLGFKAIRSRSVETTRNITVDLLALKALDDTAIDPCFEKKYCVFTYVTPWCEACKATEPYMFQLGEYLKTSKNVGYKVIVGQDQPEAIEAKAKVFGGIAYMDTDGRLAENLKIHSYPDWIVFSTADGKLVSRPHSVIPRGSLRPDQMERYVAQHLGLRPEELK